MSELKPCPFCGGKARLFVCDNDGSYYTSVLDTADIRGRKMTHCFVRCERCKCRTQPHLTRLRVNNAWNRRTVKELICQITVDGKDVIRKAIDKTEVDGKPLAEWLELVKGYKQLEADLEAVRRERDAAVAALGKSHPCESCTHFDCQWDEPPCSSCLHSDPVDNFTSNFEWRGVCPENTEVQDGQSNA